MFGSKKRQDETASRGSQERSARPQHAAIRPIGRRAVDEPFMAVRADPNDRSRVALSLSEDVPVVTVTDAAVIDPPARALRDGMPCGVIVLAHQRQFLQTPAGDEFYATRVRITSDGSELEAFVPVPAGSVMLLRDSGELPARRLAWRSRGCSRSTGRRRTPPPLEVG